MEKNGEKDIPTQKMTRGMGSQDLRLGSHDLGRLPQLCPVQASARPLFQRRL